MLSASEIQATYCLWTVKEVGGFLQKGKSWVYGEVAANRLPHLRVGGELRFEPDVVKHWARGEYHLAISKK